MTLAGFLDPPGSSGLHYAAILPIVEDRRCATSVNLDPLFRQAAVPQRGVQDLADTAIGELELDAEVLRDSPPCGCDHGLHPDDPGVSGEVR